MLLCVYNEKVFLMQNPLFTDNSVPLFDQIKIEHFMPAIDQALSDIQKKAEQFKKDTSNATFENTVVPLGSLFDESERIERILGNMTNNSYSKEISDIEGQVSIKIAAVTKAIYQDPVLGARFNAVYAQRDSLNLDADDKALLKRIHSFFEASGAFLDPAGQKRIREIDEELIKLSQKFNDNLQAAPEQQAVLITDPAELAGLSTDDIANFADKARKKKHAQGWLVVPQRLMVNELLERSESTSFRKKIFKAMNQMGKVLPLDNRPVIKDMQALRQEFARLLGYPHYADFARSRAMKTDLGEVRQFMKGVSAKVLPKFEAEMRALEQFSKDNGGPAKLNPWDVPHWASRQRDALYKFDAGKFEKHLGLENVMKGLFGEAEHLFGIQFRENTGHPVMHPDIKAYDVVDAVTGKLAGILHVDMFSRTGTKRDGAWMSELQAGDDSKSNVIILNMNITKPPAGKSAMIGLSQYITLYHEMGHSLHGLMGGNVKYPALHGTNNAPADFVEIHSMVNERRGLLKQNLQKHALHVDTGAPAPDAMIDALISAKSHFETQQMLLLVQNGLRDFEFHTMDHAAYQDDETLEKSVAINSPYADHIRPYPLARFMHLFAGAHSSYAAGYINYLIAQQHAADAFCPFEKDPYNKEQSKKLADFYRRGSGGSPSELYRDYLGRDAGLDALLADAGIFPDKKPDNKPPPRKLG